MNIQLFVIKVTTIQLKNYNCNKECSRCFQGGHSARNSVYSANDDDDNSADDVSKVIEDIREVVRRPIGRFEAIPDDMSPQAILDQASWKFNK